LDIFSFFKKEEWASIFLIVLLAGGRVVGGSHLEAMLSESRFYLVLFGKETVKTFEGEATCGNLFRTRI